MKITYFPMINFENIIVGDKLFVRCGEGMDSTKKQTAVIRITPTQLICEDAYGNIQKFYRTTGKEVGAEKGRWGWIHHSHLLGKIITVQTEPPMVED